MSEDDAVCSNPCVKSVTSFTCFGRRLRDDAEMEYVPPRCDRSVVSSE
jgi:hypothetical protein